MNCQHCDSRPATYHVNATEASDPYVACDQCALSTNGFAGEFATLTPLESPESPRTDLPREQWGQREWAALDRFMGECWDGRGVGQDVRTLAAAEALESPDPYPYGRCQRDSASIARANLKRSLWAPSTIRCND